MKHCHIKASSLVLALVLFISSLPLFSVPAEATVTMGEQYAFDADVTPEVREKIIKRIFMEDYNGEYIDLSDLGLPDSAQNKR